VVAFFLVKCQQRFDFLAQGRVGSAGVGQEGVAVRRRTGKRSEKDILRALVQRRHREGKASVLLKAGVLLACVF
jgi:hypothetical protein